MAVSGTLPVFDVSSVVDPGGNSVVVVTGAAAGPGLVSGGSLVSGVGPAGGDLIYSSEPLNTAFRRLVVALSGVSGAENVQRELALRAADIEFPGAVYTEAKRTAVANAILLNQEAQ